MVCNNQRCLKKKKRKNTTPTNRRLISSYLISSMSYIYVILQKLTIFTVEFFLELQQLQCHTTKCMKIGQWNYLWAIWSNALLQHSCHLPWSNPLLKNKRVLVFNFTMLNLKLWRAWWFLPIAAKTFLTLYVRIYISLKHQIWKLKANISLTLPLI